MNGYIILAVILIYSALMVSISWITGRKGTGNDSFFLGNRQSPWYIVAIGMIGSSLSGVTFVSVPGMVCTIDMTYMQMVFGFVIGYIVIAKLLLPMYYKLQLTSIYEYLKFRMGKRSYKTGACFFLLSKLLGAATRLYLVVVILQACVFDRWNIPFEVTACGSVLLIWLYTFRSGIRTIIWTDTLQAVCLVGMLITIIWTVKEYMHLDMPGMIRSIADSPHSRIFEFADFGSTQHFVKQFLNGIFIPIVMTGLDQDMMQKNLSCRTLKEAQTNMYVYGAAFTPINLLFLSLGILLVNLAAQTGIPLPAEGDGILPMFCTSGILGQSVLIFFTVGIIAAAFSSADSALTALTTSFCIDILRVNNRTADSARAIRLKVHVAMSAVFALIIILLRVINDRSVIDALYTIASYTYGPLLGLFAFALFTNRVPHDRYVPCICIAAPVMCYIIYKVSLLCLGYRFGYELLMLNGALTFAGLFAFRSSKYITR